jgi:hypothetical protein
MSVCMTDLRESRGKENAETDGDATILKKALDAGIAPRVLEGLEA